MTAIRVERDLNDLLRKGAAIRGETISGYANRIMREYVMADLLEDAKRTLQGEVSLKKINSVKDEDS